MSEGMLIRYDELGKRTEMKVDWGAILRGSQPDLPVEPNDIIFVPTNARMMGAVGSPVNAAFVSFAVGTAALGILAVILQTRPDMAAGPIGRR